MKKILISAILLSGLCYGNTMSCKSSIDNMTLYSKKILASLRMKESNTKLKSKVKNYKYWCMEVIQECANTQLEYWVDNGKEGLEFAKELNAKLKH